MKLLTDYLRRSTRFLRPVAFFVLGLVFVSSTWLYLSDEAKATMPTSADQFVDSVGMNVRMSYTDWPTATNWDNPDPAQNIRELLVNLGVRHLRDRIPVPEVERNITYANPRLARLYRDHGMQFITGPDTRQEGVLEKSGIAPFIDWYANGTINLDGEQIKVNDMLEAIEGPNEYDRHHNQSEREHNWADVLNDYHKGVYGAVKSQRQLRDKPVIAPSLIYTAYCGSPLKSFASSADVGNLHPYPNHPYMRHPTATLGWHLNSVKACTGEKPIWATETGYYSHFNGGSKISETTAAKYTTRLLAEYFLSGKIDRTYLHEIANKGVDGWGLIAAEPTSQVVNGWKQFKLRPKPAYYALKSLLNLLSEATWSPAERRWIAPEVRLQSVDVSFSGKRSTTHHLLLQKSTGKYFLLLWQEVENYNPTAGNFDTDLDKVSVKLPPGAHSVALHRYNNQFTFNRSSLQPVNNMVRIDVPDSVVVLEFSR